MKLKKLKLYLDTSVISYLFADDATDKMADTNIMWKDCVDNKYDLYLSTVTIEELQKCSEPKRSKMTEKLKEISFQVLSETDEINELANEYIKNEVLTQRSMDDCKHIAFEVVNNCDVIVSWNFKHLVNFKTINKVKVVNAIQHYKEISIISPSMIMGEGE